jgi:hypothetical protein
MSVGVTSGIMRRGKLDPERFTARERSALDL